MKKLHTFEEFVNESKMQTIQEAIDGDGLEFATSHGLKQTLGLQSARGYKDGMNHNPLYSLFHYAAGFPQAGLNASYFTTNNPGDQLAEVAKSAAVYLRTGKATPPIVEFIAYLYTDSAPGGRSQAPIEEAIKRIEPSFTVANKDLPAMKDTLTNLIAVLKSWSSGTPAARLNLAVAVNRVCTYSGYAGSDFTKVYSMIVASLRKNKIKLTPTSVIKVNKDNTSVDRRTIDNTSGFTSVEINEWNSVVTVDIDGKEYVAGSFQNSSGYGRY
jgi:hypothetical protein